MSENIVDDSKCVYNFLGKSGVTTSNICLGTMTFGITDRPKILDEELSHAILNRFVQWGGNFVDTANSYGGGSSEKIVGSWLKTQNREDVILATKVRHQLNPTKPNQVGLSRKHMVEAIEDSLKRLQTDYIDLYQMHFWDPQTPIEETLMTFNDLVRCGKVRYVGACNLTGWQTQKIIDVTRHLGLSPLISLQQKYSLLARQSEFEVYDVCKKEGICVLPWGPLNGGLLTGKYKRDVIPDKQTTRLGYYHDQGLKTLISPAWKKTQQDDSVWKVIQKTEEIAENKGKTSSQIALRWLLQKPLVSSVVIGVTNLKQLDENMCVAQGWELTSNEMKELDGVSEPDTPYPYQLLRLASWRTNPFI